jgi:hypothetical protein
MPARIARIQTRVLCALVALSMGLIAAATWAADEFPYQAYVLSENVDVVAGPGHRFYATDRLTRGTQVEIYREEASGWLAIRPPEGSFSWIPAEFVERLEDDLLGRVIEPTGAWIGTSVEHVSEHQQQVTLKAGELVQIIGEKSAAAKEGEKRTWLKISPPAGEYRWVHLRDVGRQKPQDVLPKVAAEVDPEDESVATALTPALSQGKREEAEPRRIELSGIPMALRDLEERRSRLDRQVEPAQFRSNTGGPGVSLSPDGFVPRRRRGEEAAAPAGSAPAFTSTERSPARPRLDPESRMATATPARPVSSAAGGSTIRGGLSHDQIARELDQIEVDLSLMVAQDRSHWNLVALRRRVETLVEGGADAAARGKARLVLEKINQFEDTFDAARAGIVSTSGTAEKTKSLDPRYDAQGWLKPVVSKKSKTPAAPYAVVDAEGQPLCFVSPSPGLNLNRYLNKQVGLYGRRGYMEELKKPHVVAERVIELNTQLR